MTGLSLRVRQSRQDEIIALAKKCDLSVAAFAAYALEQCVNRSVPVIIGNQEIGEVRVSTIISTELKDKMAVEANLAHLKVNEWAVFAVISYCYHIRHQNSPNNLLDLFFDKDSLHNQNMRYRKPQHALAKSMCEQLTSGLIGINEAGTGTGKAYACIAAGVSFAESTDQKVVVATFTRSLQKQMQETALMLEKVCGRKVKVASLYGKRNYVSPCYLKELLDSNNNSITDTDKALALEWMHTTDDWLASDLETLIDTDTFPLNIVTLSSETTDEKALLPYHQAVAKAAEADVIITSHHMLLLSMINNAPIFGFQASNIIIDEAHLLEQAASTVLGTQMSFASTKWAVNKLAAELITQGSVKAAKSIKLWASKLALLESIITNTPTQDNLIVPLVRRNSVNSIITSNKDIISALSQQPKIPRKVNLKGVGVKSLCEMKEACSLFAIINTALKSGSQFGSDVNASLSPIKKYVRVVATSRHFISKDMERLIWKKIRSAALVSATIFIPLKNEKESAAEFINSIGLKNMNPHIEPPFYEAWVYENLNIHIAPITWPQPASLGHGDPKDRRAWIDGIVGIANSLNTNPVTTEAGGIMILCTSYADSQEISDKLDDGVRPIITYAQGDDMRVIQNTFKKANGNALLVALGGFWTGVDFPGQILTDSIITRLPLLSATDPLVVSRFEYIKNNIGQPVAFASVLLPRMATMLRQGIGRVIRQPTDTGNVYITDPRILTRPKWRLNTLLKKYEPIKELPNKGDS